MHGHGHMAISSVATRGPCLESGHPCRQQLRQGQPGLRLLRVDCLGTRSCPVSPLIGPGESFCRDRFSMRDPKAGSLQRLRASDGRAWGLGGCRQWFQYPGWKPPQARPCGHSPWLDCTCPLLIWSHEVTSWSFFFLKRSEDSVGFTAIKM